MKTSKQREHLKQILQNTTNHPDANWIFIEMKKKFKNVSLATVYRNLRLLVESGQIIKIDVGDGLEHYDMNTQNHYHFVCEKCWQIADVDIPVLDCIDSMLASRLQIEVKRHMLIFYGICNECGN